MQQPEERGGGDEPRLTETSNTPATPQQSAQIGSKQFGPEATCSRKSPDNTRQPRRQRPSLSKEQI
jgi:hypothetical protein